MGWAFFMHFSLTDYQFDLPQELIAQAPCNPRDSSRLMLVERATGRISECVFRDLPTLLEPGDCLVFNDTKVIPARLIGRRPGGGLAELLLIRRLPDATWEALGRPGRKLQLGTRLLFGPDFSAEIVELLPDGVRRVRFFGEFESGLERYGRMPLPPYIQRETAASDKERYQTVYAANPGAIAAPTAGLHFTEELLNSLKGISQAKVTLHVGLGTFKPVQVEDIRQHPMHQELCLIPEATADLLNGRTKRSICVGTTSCRTLESAADPKGLIHAGSYETRLFIYPGYSFKATDALLTNFHLPGSSLLMLVSAFAGYELMREAYAKAIEKRFRFFSYGDAMLIL